MVQVQERTNAPAAEMVSEYTFEEICNHSMAEVSRRLQEFQAANPGKIDFVPDLSAAILVGGFLKGERYVGLDQRRTRAQIDRALSQNIQMSAEAVAETHTEMSLLYSVKLLKDKHGNDPDKKGQFKVADPEHGPQDPHLLAVLDELQMLRDVLQVRARLHNEQPHVVTPPTPTAAAETDPAEGTLPPAPASPPAHQPDLDRALRRLKEDLKGGVAHALDNLSPVKDLESYAGKLRLASSIIRCVHSGVESLDESVRSSPLFKSTREGMERDCSKKIQAAEFFPGVKLAHMERERLLQTERRHWVKEHADPVARAGAGNLRVYEGALSNLKRQLPRGIEHEAVDSAQGREAVQLVEACLAIIPKRMGAGIVAAEECAATFEKLSAPESPLHRLVEILSAWRDHWEGRPATVAASTAQTSESAPAAQPQPAFTQTAEAALPEVPEGKPARRYRTRSLESVQMALTKLAIFDTSKAADLVNVAAVRLLSEYCRRSEMPDAVAAHPLAKSLFEELQAHITTELPKHQKKSDDAVMARYNKAVDAYNSRATAKIPNPPSYEPTTVLLGEVIDAWQEKKWAELANAAEDRIKDAANGADIALDRLRVMVNSFDLPEDVHTQLSEAFAAWKTPEFEDFAKTRDVAKYQPCIESISSEKMVGLFSALKRAEAILSRPIRPQAKA